MKINIVRKLIANKSGYSQKSLFAIAAFLFAAIIILGVISYYYNEVFVVTDLISERSDNSAQEIYAGTPLQKMYHISSFATDQPVSEIIDDVRRQKISDTIFFNEMVFMMMLGIIMFLAIAIIYFGYSHRRGLRTEKALRLTEEKFYKIANLNPTPTYIADVKTGKLIFINDAFEKFFLLERSNAIGKTFVDLGIMGVENHSNILQKLIGTTSASIRFETSFAIANGIVKNAVIFSEMISISGNNCLLATLTDISERIETEIKLLRSEERFFSFFYLSPVPTCIVEIDSKRITYSNAACEKLLGLNSSDIVGKMISELNFSNPFAQSILFEKILNLRTKPEQLELQLETPDGVIKDVFVSLGLIWMDDKKCFIATLLDVSELRKAEEKFKESENRFFKIADLNPIPTFISEVDTDRFIYVNAAFVKLLAMPKNEIIGKTALELNLFSPYYKDEITRIILSQNGKLNNLETIIKVRDEDRHIFLSSDFIEMEGKKYFLATTLDVTDRIQIEVELKKANRLFAKLFNESPAGIVITHLNDGRIINCNNSYLKLLSCRKEDVIGKKSPDLLIIDKDQQEFIVDALKKTGSVKDIKAELTDGNGNKIWVAVSAQIIEIDNEPCILSALIDITSHKNAEEDVTRALLKEKELSFMKSNFVTLASHEFRTPLSTILSSAELLEMYKTAEQQEDRTRHIYRIKSSVKYLTSILDELLSVQRIEEGKPKIKIEQFNLRSFIEAICSDMQNVAKPGQEIYYQHNGDEAISSDATIVKHILINFISNAIKYSPDSSPVFVSSVINGNKYILSVRDKGIGISYADQKHLFKRFFRASNAVGIQGTGLGLHISKRYAEMLNGEINVRSKIGKGAEFTVIFTK